MVQPLGKDPLTAEDQVIKDAIDFDDLKRRVTPPTPENVQKRIDKLNGVVVVADATTAGKKAAAPVKSAPVVSQVSDDDEELDKSFPDYEGSAQ